VHASKNRMILQSNISKEAKRKKEQERNMILTSGKAKATATAATITRWFRNQSQTASKQPVM